MDVLTIEGGQPLKGELTISGSKNSALPILIATLLTDEPCTIRNVPNLDDIDTVVALLVFLGKNVLRRPESVDVTAGPTLHAEAPYELVRKMRASIVVMGPLLARLGRVKASLAEVGRCFLLVIIWTPLGGFARPHCGWIKALCNGWAQRKQSWVRT